MQAYAVSGGRKTLALEKALVLEVLFWDLMGLKRDRGGALQCSTVVFFMTVPLGATHQSSSSFLVFFWSDRLHRLQHLPEKVLQIGGQFVRRPEHKLDHKSFKQTAGNVSIGSVIVFSCLIDFFDLPGFGSEQHRLQIVMDKVGVNISPTVIDGVCGEIGEFQKGLDDKKAGLNAPSLAIYFAKVGLPEALGVRQGREQHFHFAIGQRHPHQPVGDCRLGGHSDVQFIEHGTGLLRKVFCDNTLFFTTLHKSLHRFTEACWQANDTMRAVVLMQKRHAVRSVAPIIYHAHILWNPGNSTLRDHNFGHVPGMKLRSSNCSLPQSRCH